MRKGLGLLFATSLLVPVGVLTATPAGSAAAKGPTCKTFAVTVTNTPPLPKYGVKTIVTSTVKTTGKIGGCTGGPVKGVTGASVAASYKYKGNCTTFRAGTGHVVSGTTSSLKWSNGKTSATTSSITLASKPGATPVLFLLTTKLTSGQYKGTTSSGKVKGTSSPGACTTTGLSKSTLAGVGGSFTFK